MGFWEFKISHQQNPLYPPPLLWTLLLAPKKTGCLLRTLNLLLPFLPSNVFHKWCIFPLYNSPQNTWPGRWIYCPFSLKSPSLESCVIKLCHSPSPNWSHLHLQVTPSFLQYFCFCFIVILPKIITYKEEYYNIQNGHYKNTCSCEVVISLWINLLKQIDTACQIFG